MPCFVHFSRLGSAKIIEIGEDLTELQSNVHCYVL